MKIPSWARLFPLMAVPVFLPALSVFFAAAMEHGADPDYMYLINGLNIVGLNRTYLITHPGIPVQIFSAFLIVAIWLVRAALQIVRVSVAEDVLLHPELYLSCIQAAISILGGVAVFFLGQRLLVATGRVVVACAAQIPFLLSYSVLAFGLPHVSAEAFLICLTALLAAVQVPLIFSPQRQECRLAMPVGLLLGACVATKFTTAPLVLTLFFFRSHAVKAIAAGWFVGAAFLLTLPISEQYQDILMWLVSILTHTGPFGYGDIGVPTFASLWENAKTAWIWAPEMIVCVAACLILVVTGIAKHRSAEGDFERLLIVSAFTIAVLLALVIKHPPIYYVVAMVGTTGLAVAGMVHVLPLTNIWMRWCGAVAGILLVGVGFHHAQVLTTFWFTTQYRDSQVNRMFIASHVRTISGCETVYYYDPREVIEWKLYTGLLWSGLRMMPVFAMVYPTFRMYDDHTQRVYKASGEWAPVAESSQFLGNECVYFVGYALGTGNVLANFLTLRARASDHPYSLAVYQFHPREARSSKGNLTPTSPVVVPIRRTQATD